MDLLSKLLHKMTAIGASDLFLSANSPPAYRVNGKIRSQSQERTVSAGAVEKMARMIMLDHQWERFTRDLEMNMAFALPSLGRFRLNVFKQRGDVAMVIRAVPPQIADLAELHLPNVLSELVMLKRGLILLVGAAGSGKSTSLAAMLEYRNAHDSSHIITIEDPIEYFIATKQCLVHQREIGVDTHSYNDALINAMRQSPDVLVIGEIRDRNTLEHTLGYADTGHLCLATFHATNAYQCFERILNMFDESRREQIMLSLALNVQAVFSQRLIPDLRGARTPAFELLRSTARVQDLIRRGAFGELGETMEKDTASGMQTFDQTLLVLVRNKIISVDTALEYADSVSNLRLQMKLGEHAADRSIPPQPRTFG